ncbi:UDP-3-O-(3-hydroxymyristoyl)glucosamine N-acyltransferase [Candidatus Marinimicrobia bacterium PRS2]|nr:UDP-3-O-(3-hydroxymyristoyl)glucosamine N-acyltransferase [Candidatus Marinimicrobia bacterium PRS2]
MFTISQIAETVNGTINGNPDLSILGVCDLKNSSADHLSYIGSDKYKEFFHQSKASAMLVSKDFTVDRNEKTLIHVENPAISFIEVVHLFHPQEQPSEQIHSSAIISPTAKIGKNVHIAAHVVLEENVRIGDGVRICAGTFIGENTTINNGTVIHPNVSIYHDVIIGKQCIIDSGSVIGADGFGLVKDKNGYHKIPHIGRVILKDSVWIGPNCCIDRGTLSDTVIGEGSKLDNLIHIAHNVQIGKNCAIAGQVGIAGSSILEDNVSLAGQVGIIGHLVIGEGSTVAAKSAVFQSLEPGSFVSGVPARNHKDRLRQDVIINQLPDILNRIRKLEKPLSITEDNSIDIK